MRDRPDSIRDIEAACAFAIAHVSGYPTETACVLHLNARFDLLGASYFESDRVDSIVLPLREIIAESLRLDAAAMILAHNHPSGSVEPSAADLRVTRQLASAADLVEVKLLDHIIVGGGGCLSFRRMGLI